MLLPFSALLALSILSAHGAPTGPDDDIEVIKSEYEGGYESCGQDDYHVCNDDYEASGSNKWDSENENSGCSVVVIDHEHGTTEGESENESHSDYDNSYTGSYRDKNGESKNSGNTKYQYDSQDTSSFLSTPTEYASDSDHSSQYHDQSDNQYSSTDKDYGKSVGSSSNDSSGESEGSYKVRADKNGESTERKQRDQGKGEGKYQYVNTANDGTITSGSGSNKFVYKQKTKETTYRGKNPDCDTE